MSKAKELLNILKEANQPVTPKKAMTGKVRVGDKVKVTYGSGADSNKTGTVVPNNTIKFDGDWSTNTKWRIQRPDWSKWVAIKFDDGRLGTMLKSRLIKI